MNMPTTYMYLSVTKHFVKSQAQTLNILNLIFKRDFVIPLKLSIHKQARHNNMLNKMSV